MLQMVKYNHLDRLQMKQNHLGLFYICLSLYVSLLFVYFFFTFCLFFIFIIIFLQHLLVQQLPLQILRIQNPTGKVDLSFMLKTDDVNVLKRLS